MSFIKYNFMFLFLKVFFRYFEATSRFLISASNHTNISQSLSFSIIFFACHHIQSVASTIIFCLS